MNIPLCVWRVGCWGSEEDSRARLGYTVISKPFWVTERSETDSDNNKNNATMGKHYGNSLES